MNEYTSKSTSQDNDNKLSQKSAAFDKEFRSLMKQAEETILAKYSLSIDLGDVRPELEYLKTYQNIYNVMKPHEHFRYFETLYGRNRENILNTLQCTLWLKEDNIMIKFGEGLKSTKEMEEKRKTVCILLSKIYLIACDLQEVAEKTIYGIDDKFAQDAGGKDLIRPNILLLHLMRIFYHLNDGIDKDKLGEIVNKLEIDLGIPTKTVGQQQTTAEPISGLSGIFTMATTMMEKMGYKAPKGLKPPSESDITAVINYVFNNENTQNTIQIIFSSLQGCPDIGSAVQKVMENVTDPKTMELLQGSVQQQSDLLFSNAGNPNTNTESTDQQ